MLSMYCGVYQAVDPNEQRATELIDILCESEEMISNWCCLCIVVFFRRWTLMNRGRLSWLTSCVRVKRWFQTDVVCVLWCLSGGGPYWAEGDWVGWRLVWEWRDDFKSMLSVYCGVYQAVDPSEQRETELVGILCESEEMISNWCCLCIVVFIRRCTLMSRGRLSWLTSCVRVKRWFQTDVVYVLWCLSGGGPYWAEGDWVGWLLCESEEMISNWCCLCIVVFIRRWTLMSRGRLGWLTSCVRVKRWFQTDVVYVLWCLSGGGP